VGGAWSPGLGDFHCEPPREELEVATGMILVERSGNLHLARLQIIARMGANHCQNGGEGLSLSGLEVVINE
jgi:hypothetical protein